MDRIPGSAKSSGSLSAIGGIGMPGASKSSALNAALNVSRVSVVLTRELFDPSMPIAEVQDPSAGAVATFIGITRNIHDGKKVLRLEYEAQESMAQKTLTTICNDAMQKFS